MLKNFLCYFLSFVFIFSSMIMVTPVLADNKVCGVDNTIYNSATEAETAGVDISYNFACVNTTNESTLYEAKSNINFTGTLIEVGSTNIPTNIIVRNNTTKEDYPINITENTILGQKKEQATNLAHWIPGDQIKVIGKKNENIESIDATTLINLAISLKNNKGINGWITKISSSTSEITYKWKNKENTFKYDNKTRFVVGAKASTTVDNLKIGDRIRVRLIENTSQIALAKIIIVLRRGNDLFMKIRTFTPSVTLVRLSSTIVPTTIQVKMDKTPGIHANDVNNLIGAEGTLITVNITENTKIVRKYFGNTTLDEFSVGDKLKIIGRINDDNTVDAKVIKNNSIWKAGVANHIGVVTGIDTSSNYLTVNWTPLQHITKKKLKEKLLKSKTKVIAQALSKKNLKDAKDTIKNKIEKVVSEKIDKLVRKVESKKIQINRIKQDGIKVGDLIKRLPEKKIKVQITNNTKIIIGTNSNATIADIKNNDKIRVRGVMQKTSSTVVADVIVVVNSLPEIEEPEDVSINDVNEVINEITTDDTSNDVVNNPISKVEKIIEVENSTPTQPIQ
ncbi:hypothetical protein KKH16_03260 [Patescibacteria group bacterium]|nr:hypothetical protein [Patescibacteria group bacterium]